MQIFLRVGVLPLLCTTTTCHAVSSSDVCWAFSMTPYAFVRWRKTREGCRILTRRLPFLTSSTMSAAIVWQTHSFGGRRDLSLCGAGHRGWRCGDRLSTQLVARNRD